MVEYAVLFKMSSTVVARIIFFEYTVILVKRFIASHEILSYYNLIRVENFIQFKNLSHSLTRQPPVLT